MPATQPPSGMGGQGCDTRTNHFLFGLRCRFGDHLYLLYAGFILSACSADTIVLIILCLLFRQLQCCD